MTCVSYAVNPAKMITPIIDIANCKAEEPKNMLTIEAIISPIKPIMRKLPILANDLLVVYPQMLIVKNIEAAIKNTLAIVAPVYTKNILASDIP